VRNIDIDIETRMQPFEYGFVFEAMPRDFVLIRFDSIHPPSATDKPSTPKPTTFPNRHAAHFGCAE
jgi:hypothetical protein